MRSANPLLVALAAALLLASLSLVTWRQARALEELAELDGLRREISLLEAERTDLETRIQALESRGRVLRTASERLGMRRPNDASGEIVLLSGTEP
ncbi:MAG: cell division protein FtsL [Gemmatimonadota bacterium]